MTIKREAAFHEAGHALAAHRSKFHNIIGSINLEDYGSGEIYVSLSKEKLQTQGKAPNISAERDKEVAADLAVVLAAGLVAEQVAEVREHGLTANIKCAVPDHKLLQLQLANAGLSKKFDIHQNTARQLLEAEWSLVVDLSNYLFENISAPSADVIAFIESNKKTP